MLSKTIKLCGYLNKSLFLSVPEKRLRSYLQARTTKRKTRNGSDLIVVQCVEDYYYLSLFFSITTAIHKTKNIRVEQYIVRSLRIGITSSIKQFIASLLFSNQFSDAKWIRFYRVFCDGVAYSTTGIIRSILDVGLLIQAFNIWSSFRSKEQLLTLRYGSILIGDFIYDSYLRFKPSPTVELRNIYLLVIIWQAIRTVKYSKRYFENKLPKAYLTSYATYIQHGIPVRVAINAGIQVYSFGNFQEFAKRLSAEDSTHTRNGANYRQEFDQLLEKEKKLQEAESQLNFRLAGGVDTATAYMTQSAYLISSMPEKTPDLSGSLVIFLHDFYDSPHIYKWMLFPDFYDWVCFTIEVLQANNIPFYLKPHPNQIDLSSQVILDLKSKYDSLKWINPTTNNIQLVEAGIASALTVYGTVAHEMAYLGIPVISCGDHPHISFNFCYNATTIEEYSNLLVNALSLQIKREEMKLQSKMFYYMHNLNKSDVEKNISAILLKLYKATQVETLKDKNVEAITDLIDELVCSESFQLLCQEKFIDNLI